MLIQVDLSNDRVLSEYERWDNVSLFNPEEPYSHSCTRFMQECVHPDDRNAFSAAFCRKNLKLDMDEESPVSYLEYRMKRPSGRYKWVAGTLVPLADEATRELTAIAYVVDIDERRRREDAAIDKSRRDDLTGLLNRNAMFEHIVSVIEEDEDGTARHSLLMIDLDNFKAINDNFGHAFGDAVLREAADAIRSVFRPTDAISRIGGDEFLVFLEGVSASEILSRKAGEVVRACTSPTSALPATSPSRAAWASPSTPTTGGASFPSSRARTPPCTTQAAQQDGYSFVEKGNWGKGGGNFQESFLLPKHPSSLQRLSTLSGSSCRVFRAQEAGRCDLSYSEKRRGHVSPFFEKKTLLSFPQTGIRRFQASSKKKCLPLE